MLNSLARNDPGLSRQISGNFLTTTIEVTIISQQG
jgi:hypothetical protein